MRMLYCLLLCCLFLLVGCNSAESTPTAVAVIPKNDPQPTNTSTPRPTATNTDVPPTKTPRPTWTVIPTNTPELATVAIVVTEVEEDVGVSAEITPTNTPLPTATTETIEPTQIVLQPTVAAPEPTEVPAVATPGVPTATPVPTWTPQPAAPTAVPPTATQTPSPQPTQVPASATPMPPTATATLRATNTPSPPTNTPPPPKPLTTNIGDIAALPADTEVTISGNIVAASSFARGFKFTVQDGTGRVTLLMWDNVYDECWDKNILNVGATIVATGNTGNFDGEIQVAPWWGGGVNVTTPGYPWAPPHPINELGGFMNQRAMIEGTVSSVDVAESFTKMIVNDGTGEVEVFMWPNIWVRVPNKDALNGSRVKVVGIVGEFRGTLQLVPPLPYDVVKQ